MEPPVMPEEIRQAYPNAQPYRMCEMTADHWCTGRWDWVWGYPHPVDANRMVPLTEPHFTDYDPVMVAQVQRGRRDQARAEGH